MAKQSGIVPMQGTIANITFTRTPDGFIAKLKSDLNKERIKTDPKFERTRENATEFETAGFGAETLRTVFIKSILNCFDRKLQSRLVKALMVVVKSDIVSDRGKRNLVNGNDTLMNKFAWNKNGGFTSVAKCPFSVTVDRVAGTVTVSIPSFTPDIDLILNPEATHYKITTAAAAIDWNAVNTDADMIASAYLPCDDTPTVAINNVLSLTAGTTLPIFTSLSINFYQQVGSKYYSLKNLQYDVASIEDVNP